MPDYDLEATAVVRDAQRGVLAEAACATCKRPIYRDRPFPGVPIEWRHRSSGQPISWSPSKHIAGRHLVVAHGHRFGSNVKGVATCEVMGCDAELPFLDKAAITAASERRKAANKSVKEAAMQESRARGAKHSHKAVKERSEATQ